MKLGDSSLKGEKLQFYWKKEAEENLRLYIRSFKGIYGKPKDTGLSQPGSQKNFLDCCTFDKMT